MLVTPKNDRAVKRYAKTASWDSQVLCTDCQVGQYGNMHTTQRPSGVDELVQLAIGECKTSLLNKQAGLKLLNNPLLQRIVWLGFQAMPQYKVSIVLWGLWRSSPIVD